MQWNPNEYQSINLKFLLLFFNIHYRLLVTYVLLGFLCHNVHRRGINTARHAKRASSVFLDSVMAQCYVLQPQMHRWRVGMFRWYVYVGSGSDNSVCTCLTYRSHCLYGAILEHGF